MHRKYKIRNCNKVKISSQLFQVNINLVTCWHHAKKMCIGNIKYVIAIKLKFYHKCAKGPKTDLFKPHFNEYYLE